MARMKKLTFNDVVVAEVECLKKIENRSAKYIELKGDDIEN